MARPKTLPPKRPIIINRANIQIPLPCGKRVILDKQDLHLVQGHNWLIKDANANTYYIFTIINTNGIRKAVYLHKLLMNPFPGEYVDFRNDDILDYRRANLEIVTLTKRRARAQDLAAVTLAKPKVWQPQYAIE